MSKKILPFQRTEKQTDNSLKNCSFMFVLLHVFSIKLLILNYKQIEFYLFMYVWMGEVQYIVNIQFHTIDIENVLREL